MEALLEKEGTVENWNDDRLDELSQTMKEGFAQVDKRFTSLEGEIKKGFERLDDRIFKLMIMMLIFCGGLVTTLLVAILGRGGS